MPNKNSTKTPASNDTQVTDSIKTIIAIGKTDESDSFVDEKICVIYNTPIPNLICLYIILIKTV